MAWSWERMFLFILFSLLAFWPHSFLVLLGKELLLLVWKIMIAFPAVTSSREDSDVELNDSISLEETRNR